MGQNRIVEATIPQRLSKVTFWDANTELANSMDQQVTSKIVATPPVLPSGWRLTRQTYKPESL